VIARLWRGWTSPENAEPYERFLREQMFPSMQRVSGFRGAELLRREAVGEVAFVTITRFDSYDAVRAFAGEEYERAVIEPEARALLSRHDDRSEHFDVAIES
jgi:antibiotic biosynthesis monooxygenase (ABM) superfamily enzyme